MFETVHPLFLFLVGLTFGLQAAWGAATGNYLRRSGLRLIAISKSERPVEYRFVMAIYSLVTFIAFGMFIVKAWLAP